MQPTKSIVTQAAPQASTVQTAAVAKAITEAGAAADTVRRSGMILEIGITFKLTHYIHIFQSFARGLFQSFRPLLILYVFSHILKAVFFIMGEPQWCAHDEEDSLQDVGEDVE